jgi:hypothetical protein
MPDTDADGMDDGWETSHFGNLGETSVGDFDGDGRTNGEEFADGTDPTDAGSTLGLVAYYPLDGNASDESGNGYDAQLQGGASVTSSFLQLGENTSDYLSIPNIAADGLTDYSFCARVKLDRVDSYSTLFSAASSQNDNEINMNYENNAGWFTAGNDFTNGHLYFSREESSDLDWHYVVFTRQGNIYGFYIDDLSPSFGLEVAEPLTVSVSGLVVGQEQDAVGGGFNISQNWEGCIDDIRIYNRALSSSEVSSLYVASRPEAAVETGFENGLGNWTVENGVWEVGIPTSGPGAAYAGTNVAATVLDGNYPEVYNQYNSHRLVSPSFIVPDVGENPRLRFWHWLGIGAYDFGYVEIRVNGGGWTRD